MGIRRLRLTAATAAVGALALAGLNGPTALAATAGTAGASGATSASAPTIPTTTDTQRHTGAPHSEPVCTTAPKPGQATCFALKRTDISAVKGVMRGKGAKSGAATPADAQPNTNPPAGYGPSDLLSAYSLPADGGAGATIAIVDAYDDPNAEADLAVYRAQYGLPACTTANGCLSKVNQTGGPALPPADSSWAGEISLDLDMVSAVAPDAHILLVEASTASTDDLGTGVDTAVALGAKYVSNSYGSGYSSAPGSGEDASETTAADPYYNHPGVAVVASSGDSAYGVTYPAASQYVTSVGGTSLTKSAGTGRGWTESAWSNSYGGGGSGCSVYESKPTWQTDTGCAKRTVADVSAVADPATGLAVYQTYGGSGWAVYGGTSASAPIITATYADAGTPAQGSYPSSYPYNDRSALNDVTSGSNGHCTPAYYCTAQTGYDGPTGLGTPNGTDAFSAAPHGQVKGTITDATTGDPVADAVVSAGGRSVTTAADGSYDLYLSPGTYDVTAGAYGFATGKAVGVTVTDGGVVTENLALAEVARVKVSGTVKDGSGQGWPLYASISVEGATGGPVHTDPKTGAYTVYVPVNADYTLDFTPYYRGYQSTTSTISAGTSSLTDDVQLPIDTAACTAAGYQLNHHGLFQSFDDKAVPDGWSVASAAGTKAGWVFTNPLGHSNLTTGDGNFAIVDADAYQDNIRNTTLTSPATDLSTFTADDPPVLSFGDGYAKGTDTAGAVQLSTDGGATWTTVWNSPSATSIRTVVSVPLPQAAGQSQVQIRFAYSATTGGYWEVDNVQLGGATCDPQQGGLLVGKVTDANTGAALAGVAVTDAADSTVSATSTVVDDTALGGAFYWAFVPGVSSHTVDAALAHYASAASTVAIVQSTVTEADFAMKAGRVELSSTSLSATAKMGGTAKTTLTVRNTGTAPATVTLSAESSGYTAASVGATGNVPTRRIAGPFSAGPAALAAANATPAERKAAATALTAAQNAVGPADSEGWQPIADVPAASTDNVVETVGGVVYSGLGFAGNDVGEVNTLYAYDPATGSWTQKASAHDKRDAPAHAAIDGRIYVVGGWTPQSTVDSSMEIYDPATDSWSTGATIPSGHAGAASAAAGGKMYVVGGCTNTGCGSTDALAYDPSQNTWTKIADYPEPTAWEACGGIAGKLYCAGGYSAANADSAHAYVYDPATDAWSPIASLPKTDWGTAYTSANGQLLLQDGVVDTALSNQGWAYDPATDSWTELPNTPVASYRFGGSQGFYAIGGSIGVGDAQPTAQVLAGWDQPSDGPAPWLSLNTPTLTLAAGASTKVTVTFDAADASVAQPGNYTGRMLATTDTPYRVPAVGVTMTVKPPNTWGKLAGTVQYRDAAGALHPLPGATIRIISRTASYTVHSDRNGQYGYWLPSDKVTVLAAKDGYQPDTVSVKVAKGVTTTQDWTLLRQ
ncbi:MULTISPECIES: carboxypeptidase regulatory-like domain-containing protein [Streptacidiphilus]|uniref:Carboxypeptidase regulatory-like domain-containing protein n=1 Tax=Streptacidiphilus cavernicola TaxID=3342716 RepID=A0ABV6V0N1_9ACTN|nr:carboxypeptidase regulatory-like domain-containing protein [Streptacidiphilus jeojiense]